MRKDDATVAGSVIHGWVIAMDHETIAAENVGGRIGREMRNDGALATWIVKECADGPCTTGNWALVGVNLGCLVIDIGREAGITDADRVSVLSQISV